MLIEQFLTQAICQTVNVLFQIQLTPQDITVQRTNKEFEGEYTLVVFPYVKHSKLPPPETANLIGNTLIKNFNNEILAYNSVKGFLNLVLSHTFLLNVFKTIHSIKNYGYEVENSKNKTIMVEYASPNTNKPLHLGHVRNCLLGYSLAQILKTQGYHIIKASIVNDRGVHICKSMYAWQQLSNGETPQSSGIKGDHLVGKYYVLFNNLYKKEVEELLLKGLTKEEAEKQAPCMLAVNNMLVKWEAKDEEVLTLWKTMNNWVYKGFDETYEKLGVNFDLVEYEHNTYLYGKTVIKEGLNKKVFYKKDNGSVCVDLTPDGLDEKVLLRSNGTSIYITQDIGTAIERFKNHPQLIKLIYTVGNEQDYHFKALFKTLEKLNYTWAKDCYHLSYGMVELPDGKMKSREGTVVDADDLIESMISTAQQTTEELEKTSHFDESEKIQLYKTIAMGALKYFILKVDPKKKMLFDPKESIDLQGHTGPFIQYTFARIQSILSKINSTDTIEFNAIDLHQKEKELIILNHDFKQVLQNAANQYNPAILANYIYEVAKLFNQFYSTCPIIKEHNTQKQNFRIQLIKQTANIIKPAMLCLGIEVPNRM